MTDPFVIPILETERLFLRGPDARDAEAVIALLMSERAQFIGRKTTRAEAWRTFAMEIGHWTIHGFGLWAVTAKDDDRILGMVGPWYPEGWPEKEIGWSVMPQAEGRGIAHEAALAARDFAYGTLGWTTAVSYIDPRNTRSIRLAERLGAWLDPDAAHPDFGGDPCTIYRHPGPEALA
ncbi:MAG: GNAT family N-acetyltransferase [Pseudomonadota bacterium]